MGQKDYALRGLGEQHNAGMLAHVWQKPTLHQRLQADER